MNRAVVLLSGGQDSAGVDDAFGHWLAGFIDGEGCFTIATRTWPTGHVNYSPRFRLGLRDDDGAIIREIAARTGLGSVRAQHQRSAINSQLYWEVLRKAECVALVELLRRYPLRSKKGRDLEVWAEAVAIWAAMEHVPRRPGGRGFEPGDWGRIPELATALREGRRYQEAVAA